MGWFKDDRHESKEMNCKKCKKHISWKEYPVCPYCKYDDSEVEIQEEKKGSFEPRNLQDNS